MVSESTMTTAMLELEHAASRPNTIDTLLLAAAAPEREAQVFVLCRVRVFVF